MLQNHKVIPAVKSKIEDKRKEIQQKINNNAELSEMQQEFKKLEKLEQTALLSKEYLQKYIEVMEEVDNFKLPNASF
jgi:predicted transcriptional regulator